jgi:hypothetical protein
MWAVQNLRKGSSCKAGQLKLRFCTGSG